MQRPASSALLQGVLTEEGVSIEAGAAGLPTAFVASYGSGALARPAVAAIPKRGAHGEHAKYASSSGFP